MPKKDPLDWYSVRCIFRWEAERAKNKRHLYEERITIWRADSPEDAVELAEEEAERYAEQANAEYLRLAQIYQMFPNRLSSGAEVFSLLREHNYAPKRYLDRYFDTGEERQEDIPCE